MHDHTFSYPPKDKKDPIGITTTPGGASKLKLELIETLFQTLHEHDINYCHWKSNQHLDASMRAETDLDVLFDPGQKASLEKILNGINFKKLIPIKVRQYHQIEDFIGLDYSSGRIVHLHTHFGLTIGELYLKSYQLQIENKILKSRVWDDEFEIYRIHPAFELILLFYRHALKLRSRDRLKAYVTGKASIKNKTLKEYDWLKERCTDKEIETKLETMLPHNSQYVYPLITGRFDRNDLMKLAKILRRLYKHDRIYSPLKAKLLKWYREFYIKALRKYSRWVNRPIVLQRVNPRGGLAIAIIGADGSGKSTIIENLHSSFKTKLDVFKIYFGRGRGKVSWYRKMLVALKDLWVSIRENIHPNQPRQQGHSKNHSVVDKQNGANANVFHFLEGLMVAWERNANLRNMQLGVKKGMLVICDRFPQNQILVFNDGKCLQQLANAKNPILRIIAKIESTIYNNFDQQTPDIIFKLIANAEVIEARKPGETSLETLQQKIEWVKQMKFPASCKVVTVNAEEPIEKVLYSIRKNIWEAYK